jgi:hypothetical protein
VDCWLGILRLLRKVGIGNNPARITLIIVLSSGSSISLELQEGVMRFDSEEVMISIDKFIPKFL